MNTGLMIFLEILILVIGVVVVAAVLMQHGKAHGLSGAIAGGAETFFGKEQGKRWDKILARVTTVIGVVFVLVVLLLYVFTPDPKFSTVSSVNNWNASPFWSTTVTETVDTTEK